MFKKIKKDLKELQKAVYVFTDWLKRDLDEEVKPCRKDAKFKYPEYVIQLKVSRKKDAKTKFFLNLKRLRGF